MTFNDWFQSLLYLVLTLACAKPLGLYMARVHEGRAPALEPALGPFERLLYRLCGVDEREGMTWQTYALALMLFNGLGLLAVYALQRVQHPLPLNPMGMGPVSPDSAFNTAVSFATNTDWQGYAGESTMSYLTQMLALTAQNFVSAATGMAVAVALARSFALKQSESIGNFWVDLVRTTLYILLPLSVPLALLLAWQGVPQTLRPSPVASLVQPIRDDKGVVLTSSQTIAVGPVASQVAIKQLGTNGGGFFNANSAHPFENPTPLSNWLELLSINLIGAALCYSFGVLVGDRRQGWALLAAMTLIFAPLLWLGVASEQAGNPRLAALGVDQAASPDQSGGNMVGKEVRFGIADSAIWAAATTAASNGSVNAMHDSFTPLGGLVPLALIQSGEVVYGGVGSGLYGMLLFVVVAVFIAGLMVGRTPEYLGKKIEAYEMKMAALGVLTPCAFALVGTAAGLATELGRAGILNPGPHGFTEVLYAFTSGAGNNGSAFAGINANTVFYNTALGLDMFFSRFWIIVPVLALAGALAKKKIVPASSGTLPTHGPLFVVFLVGVVLLVGALTFFPALALGPIVEHLMLRAS